jgi:hypothetical protein
MAMRYSVALGVGVGRSRTTRSSGPYVVVRNRGSELENGSMYLHVFLDLNAFHLEVVLE